MNNTYYLLFKTGDAEFRALENIKFEKNSIIPIIEITRGRISTKDKIGAIEKRVSKIKKIFGGFTVCLDLTTVNDLSNSEIEYLYDCKDGYLNWSNFLDSLRHECNFKEIIPTLLVDTDDKSLVDNLMNQTNRLAKLFSTIAYRNSIVDDGCYDDINSIKNILVEKNIKLMFIIDCEYVPSGAFRMVAEKVSKRIEKIKSQITNVQFVVLSTSYPKYISEIGNDYSDTFQLNEIDIFDIADKKHNGLLYGDYGSINPVRNDQIIMSNGWIPRIDIPLEREIFYYRKRRGDNKYSDTYIAVANSVIADSRFPNWMKNVWGINQVKLCADGNAPGSSPSFWISVRMNIHIEQQLRRLNLK